MIFDAGFDPWWPYGYPYDSYAYDSYPYDYDSDAYDQGVYQGEESNPNAYGSNDQDADSTVAAAQQQVLRSGLSKRRSNQRKRQQQQHRHGQNFAHLPKPYLTVGLIAKKKNKKAPSENLLPGALPLF